MIILYLLLAGVLLWWLWSHFGTLRRMDRKILLLCLLGLVLIGAGIIGRLPWFSALIGAVLPWLGKAWPWLMRALGLWTYVKKQQRIIRLQHDDKGLDGLVLRGPLQQRTLNSLTPTELQQLRLYCQQDPFSLALLKQWWTLSQLGSWQEAPPPAAYQPMSKDEALAVLGLPAHADRADIVAAHRRLISRLHPDKGGSDWLAVRVNTARDILLATLPQDDPF
ncbi:hypothetical protein [Pokkaliibacter plantistimulans]|uniref:hypothetical protein n=1 Tax=Pokkaliibacter plantistimulans TaxID=1635171 RepID=UPI000D7454CF|nr:hypothetical protein [Pokkaliibacter plantistimulans]